MNIIEKDLRRKQEIYRLDGAEMSFGRTLLTDGTSANVLFRLAGWLAVRGPLKVLALLLQWLNQWMNQCVIGTGARFGPGFVLLHPVGVVINSKVRGGQNVALESGVVIGDEKGRSPVLGSNVFVGAGAKIIGGIEIGDNVNIGANAVVVKSLPSNCTAVGIPAKVVRQRGSNADPEAAK